MIAVAAFAATIGCIQNRHTFFDGNILTISGRRNSAPVTETYTADGSQWVLWLRYEGQRVERPAGRVLLRCDGVPSPRPPVVAARFAGAVAPLVAEFHWFSILRNGDTSQLPLVQIPSFVGIGPHGRADPLEAEVKAMHARTYRVVANCIVADRQYDRDGIATIRGRYYEYTPARAGYARIAYDSTDTFVRRGDGWYAASGFATFLGVTRTKAVPDSCTPESNADRALSAMMKQFGVTSLGFAEVRNGAVVHTFTRGASEHTRFQIGSVTKMLTASAVVAAAWRSEFSLQQPIARLLSGLPACVQTLTADELLSQDAGLVDLPGADGPHADQSIFSLAHSLGNGICIFPPRVSFSYSNAGYSIAGALLAATQYRTYEAAMSSLLFAPLRFTDTTFDPVVAQSGDHATGWTVQAGKRVAVASYADDVRLRPAGYASSSLADLTRFAAAFQRDTLPGGAAQIISAPRVPIPALFTDGRYGYGLMIRTDTGGETVEEHAGDMPGFGALVRFLPHRNVAFIVLANADGIPMPQIVDGVDRILTGRLASFGPDLHPGEPVTGSDAQRWAGTYANGTRISVTLAVKGNTLHLQAFGTDGVVVHAGGDQYLAEPQHLRLSLVQHDSSALLRLGLWTLVKK